MYEYLQFCIEPANDGPVGQHMPDGGKAQRFLGTVKWDEIGKYYKFRSVRTGSAIMPQDGSVENGAHIVSAVLDDSNRAQEWEVLAA